MAASPLSDYIATCTTLHPSDTIAAVIAHRQQCLIMISPSEGNQGPVLPVTKLDNVPTLSLDANSLLFSLQRYLEDNDSVDVHWEDWATQWATKTCMASIDRPSLHAKDSPEEIAHATRQELYMNPDLAKARFAHLAAIACKDSVSLAAQQRHILPSLVQEVFRLSCITAKQTVLSSRILRVYAVLATKLHMEEVIPEELVQADEHCEQCSICGHEIALESVRWARCQNGHQFSRCALTLIALQESGSSKACQLCDSQYLDPMQWPRLDVRRGSMKDSQVGSIDEDDTSRQAASRELDEVAESTAQDIEPPSGLARILFAACDTCILCGGGFGA